MRPLSPPSPRHRRFSRGRVRRHHSQAFATVELVIGILVGVFVVMFWSVYVLLPQLRVARDFEVNQSLVNNWSRSLAFMTNEASHAFWIRTSLGTDTYACGGAAPDEPLLVLDGPPNPADPDSPLWRIVYGARPNTGTTETWRGFYRLVRCGPPFATSARGATDDERREAAMSANLDLTKPVAETVLTDFLADRRSIPCPSATSPIPGTCWQPFDVRLYDSNSARRRERDAQLNLYLSRLTGENYPTKATFPGFHAHIRANRNPGFDVTGKSNCVTTTDALGNQEPPATADCQSLQVPDPTRRKTLLKEFTLPSSGTLFVNKLCSGTSEQCDAPKVTDVTEVIYLRGSYASYATNQFSDNDSTRPCSRKKCYLSNGSQSVTIYDGNMLVFVDRIIRL